MPTFAAAAEETLSPSVYKELTRVESALESQAYDEAFKILRELRSSTKLSPYEANQVWSLEAYVSYLKDDYKAAIVAYNEVLRYEGLAEGVLRNTLKTLAQLHFIQEDYAQALTALKQLFAHLDEVSSDLYLLQAQAYYQLDEFDKALSPIKSAIETEKAHGNHPKEDWLLLLRAIYYEKKDYKSMVVLHKELIDLYPKDSYVQSLAALYGELGDTKKQMALTEALFEKGYLKGETYVINLANLYLLHKLPYKAANVLQTALGNQQIEVNERNLRLLAQAWSQAREDANAIPPTRLAAKMSKDGELYIRLAQSHIQLEQWAEATDALQKGLRIGGLRKPNSANIMLGMALFNQQKLESAREAFLLVAGSELESDRKAANTWLAFLDAELGRTQ